MTLETIFAAFNTDADINYLNQLSQGFQNSPYYHSMLSLEPLFKEFVTYHFTRCNIDFSLKLDPQTGTAKQEKPRRSTRRSKTINAEIDENETIEAEIDENDENDAEIPTNETIEAEIDENDENDAEIPVTSRRKPKESKLITYGSDIRVQLSNLLGLFGYEFATSIMTISFLPATIEKLIISIDNAKDYADLQRIVMTIINIYSINNGDIFRDKDDGCAIDENKLTIKMSATFSSNEKRFANILSFLELKLAKNSLVTIEEDKQTVKSQLKEIQQNTVVKKCIMHNIDNLCIELAETKECYDGYFMKMWEIMLKETYADYYEYENVFPRFRDAVDDDINKLEIPFIAAMKRTVASSSQLTLQSNNIEILVYKYMKYIKDYFVSINKKVTSIINSDCYENTGAASIRNAPKVSVHFEEYFYELLSIIFINMLFNVAQNIVVLHQFTNTVGKSVKLQFPELYHAIRLTTPKLTAYSTSQSLVLYYVLLTKDSIDKYYETKRNAAITSGRTARTTRKTVAAAPRTTRKTVAAAPRTTRKTVAAAPRTTRKTVVDVPRTTRKTPVISYELPEIDDAEIDDAEIDDAEIDDAPRTTRKTVAAARKSSAKSSVAARKTSAIKMKPKQIDFDDVLFDSDEM